MRISNWIMKVVTSFAFVLAVGTVNMACNSILHQPEIPESLLQYKK